MAERIRNHIRSNVVGFAALFLVLTGGSAYATHPGGANTISSGDIINGEVKSGDIGDFEVKAADVAPDSLGGGKIANQSVKNSDLGLGASSSNTIADGGIQAIDVKNNTLTGGQIDEGTLFNDNSLTGGDIDESTLSGVPSVPTGPAGGDLASTYPNPTIANAAVVEAKLADAAVTIPKLAFDPATQSELDNLATDDGDPPNAGSNALNWNRLGGVPGGIADGDDVGWDLGGNSGTTGADFLGTTDSQPFNLRVNDARGLRLEPASDGINESPNVIGGIADNQVTPGVYAATIAGGGRSNPSDPATANEVTDGGGTVGGGAQNQAGDDAGGVGDKPFAVVGGGVRNTASGDRATVGGGQGNIASGGTATVGGGDSNMASVHRATVGGGLINEASGFAATVPGGFLNIAHGDYSLAGGFGAQANDNGAFVWADSNPFDFASTAQNQFNVRSTGGARLVSGIDGSGAPTSGLELPADTSGWSTLVNGQPFDVRVNNSRGLRIEPATDFAGTQSPNVIGGTADNAVTSGVHSAVIGGGGRGVPGDPATANRVTDHQGVVGGGANNQAGDDAGTTADRTLATVGGGGNNKATGELATVAGGFFNHATEGRATVGGGVSNTASNFAATVGGGNGNNASGDRATVGGGQGNNASGDESTVGGGLGNDATGPFATVPGGFENTAQGDYSLAAGRNAQSNHTGAFVWADSQGTEMNSRANDQFIARAAPGFFLTSNSTLPEDQGLINTSAGANVDGTDGAFLSDAGAWTDVSDENEKEGFAAVDPNEVLAKLAELPVRSWQYKAEPGVRHIGPVAQDFHRAFGLGADDRHIASLDTNGVALAAIKGLQDKLRAERRRRLEQERRFEARLAALERGGR